MRGRGGAGRGDGSGSPALQEAQWEEKEGGGGGRRWVYPCGAVGLRWRRSSSCVSNFVRIFSQVSCALPTIGERQAGIRPSHYACAGRHWGEHAPADMAG